MYNCEKINELVSFIQENDGIADKSKLILLIKERFSLTKDRSVYYCEWFSIRFCKSKSRSFSNTVLALSVLQKYDKKPFIVCLITPTKNFLMLANSTFLRKISHSSQELRIDNIRGSFNGSDIIKFFEDVENAPNNFEFLFTSHENYNFEENLKRLVEATNNIHPNGKRFTPNIEQKNCIMQSIQRSIDFISSKEYKKLNFDLKERVNAVSSEIAIAAFIDNVNLRGRIIEYLITSSSDLKSTLIKALHNKEPLPEVFTSDKLGDYERNFEKYITATDIKTKILFLSSNPKGYNIDKLLHFLANDKSVYLIFIIAIDSQKNISTQLCSMYNSQLLNGTRIIKHWAGRNSIGVTQYDGRVLEEIINNYDCTIDKANAKSFLKQY